MHNKHPKWSLSSTEVYSTGKQHWFMREVDAGPILNNSEAFVGNNLVLRLHLSFAQMLFWRLGTAKQKVEIEMASWNGLSGRVCCKKMLLHSSGLPCCELG